MKPRNKIVLHYTDDVRTLLAVECDGGLSVEVFGDGDNGSYEWRLGVCRTFQVFRALGVSATIGALLPRARPYEPFCPS